MTELKTQSREVLNLAKQGLDVAERQVNELISNSSNSSERESLEQDLGKIRNGQKELEDALES